MPGWSGRPSGEEFDADIANGNPAGGGRVAVNTGEIFTSTGCQDGKAGKGREDGKGRKNRKKAG